MIPIHLSSGSPSQVINNDKKEESKATPVSSKIERVIPIKREGDQLVVRKNISGSLAKQLNGSIDTSKPTPPSRQGKINTIYIKFTQSKSMLPLSIEDNYHS